MNAELRVGGRGKPCFPATLVLVPAVASSSNAHATEVSEMLPELSGRPVRLQAIDLLHKTIRFAGLQLCSCRFVTGCKVDATGNLSTMGHR